MRIRPLRKKPELGDSAEPEYAEGKIEALVEIYDDDVCRKGVGRQQRPHEDNAEQRIEDVYAHAP